MQSRHDDEVMRWYFSSTAGQEQHHSLGVDAGGCQLCEAQFKNWLSNRTKETYWNSLSTSTEVADHLCRCVSHRNTALSVFAIEILRGACLTFHIHLDWLV